MNFGNTHLKHGQGAVNAALGVMLCLVLALFAFTSWGNRQHSLQSGLASASTQTRNLESFLTQSLNIIELSATNFETYTLLGIDWDEVNPRLLDAVRAAPFLRSLAIADANGVIVACSALEDVGETVELGSLFPQADASIQVVRVGTPQTGRDWASRTPVATTPMAGGNAASPQFVPVVVPISNSHTTYWLVAALNPDLFVTQATHLLGASSSRVAWLRYDGLPLWTSDTDSAGALANHARELGHRLPDKEFGQAPQTLSDGSEVLGAYRASSRYPTAVAVYLDKQEVLAPWRGTTLEQLAVLLLRPYEVSTGGIFDPWVLKEAHHPLG